MGWFYGFKLHIVINDRGEIIQWMLTPGNVDDREPLKDKKFKQRLFGKIFADRGYITRVRDKKKFKRISVVPFFPHVRAEHPACCQRSNKQ